MLGSASAQVVRTIADSMHSCLHPSRSLLHTDPACCVLDMRATEPMTSAKSLRAVSAQKCWQGLGVMLVPGEMQGMV